MIILVMLITALVGLDQFLGHMIRLNIQPNAEKWFWIVKITNVQNTYSIGNFNFTWAVVAFVIILLASFLSYFFIIYAKKVKSKFNFIPFALVISGCISMFIDLVFRKSITTYIEIPLIAEGLVFSLSGMYIVLGLILLIVYYLIKVTNDKVKKMDV